MAIHFDHAGQGEPVLLIQGTGVAGCAWKPQVEGLRDRFQLAWFDNPGIGASPGPAGDMGHMVAAAVEVLDAMGWDSAHVAGHSLGGVVAQRLVLDHPARVRSLALLSTLAQGKATLSFSPELLNCPLHTFDSGHALPVERADEVNTVLRAFWDEASASSPVPEGVVVADVNGS